MRYISFLPMNLFAKTVNAISKFMGNVHVHKFDLLAVNCKKCL